MSGHHLNPKKYRSKGSSPQRTRSCQEQDEDEDASTKQHRDANFPISTGKPSLRRRLEAYYSLIAPDVISNESEWRKKFELIYDKYGGSEDGERTLSRKLMKKYGDVVRLRLATRSKPKSSTSGTGTGIGFGGKMQRDNVSVRSEEWYQVTPMQQNSGDMNFTSELFDPVAVISAPSSQIIEINPYVKDAPRLDNISKFPSHLPPCDPLYRAPRIRPKQVQAHDTRTSTTTTTTSTATPTSSMKMKIPVFTAMASRYEKSGPLSLLHSIHVKRDRIKVSVRYVDCMRGTLTGYLIAFDKHMNMILRDVDEVYTSRATMVCGNDSTRARARSRETWSDDNSVMQMAFTKAELEWKRRLAIMEQSSCGSGKGVNTSTRDNGHQSMNVDHNDVHVGRIKVGKRHMHQILVRGDNVVSVWRASGERCKG